MSLQETEIDRFQAPEEAAAEEDKLRVEREEKEKQQIKVSICSCYANVAAKFGTQTFRCGVTVNKDTQHIRVIVNHSELACLSCMCPVNV